MFIILTSLFDNKVQVNINNIESIEISEGNIVDDNYPQPCCLVQFVSGRSLKVQECRDDINEILAYHCKLLTGDKFK